jgi:hypothetical protein
VIYLGVICEIYRGYLRDISLYKPETKGVLPPPSRHKKTLPMYREGQFLMAC